MSKSKPQAAPPPTPAPAPLVVPAADPNDPLLRKRKQRSTTLAPAATATILSDAAGGSDQKLGG